MVGANSNRIIWSNQNRLSVLYQCCVLFVTIELVTFVQVKNPANGNSTTTTCPNNDAGCKVYGRASRWPVTNGQISGAEEIVIDGFQHLCAQFGAGSTNYLIMGPDNMLYLGAGTGSNPKSVDYGQYGNNPCNTGSGAAGGAFRAQDTATLDGKITRIDPTTKAFAIQTIGCVPQYCAIVISIA
jgi:glucose/arabinose dehydrogenase